MDSGVAVRQTRSLPVPEGLDGLRLDQAVARLFGLSRTTAAGLVEAGDVTVDGAQRPKSEPVRAGAWLEVALPTPPAPPSVTPTPVAGLRIIHSDADLVVVDKPVGVAAHPSPGWTGPTVVGALAAMGHTIATSGAAERQGVVHRLDADTTGVMVVAKSESAYSRAQAGLPRTPGRQALPRRGAGAPDPLRGTIEAPIDRHPHHDYKWAVVTGGKPSVTHYETLEAFRAAV